MANWLRIMAKPAVLLWKLWALFWAYVPVVVLSPLVALVVALPFPAGFRLFSLIERTWARLVLLMGGWRIKILNPEARPTFKRQYIIVANHESMLDIPVLLSVIPAPVSFVGKVELARYPVFGWLYRRTNILVDRSSLESRQQVYRETERYIRNGINVAIFPEGGIIEDGALLHPFKAGAFRMAVEHQLPVLPMIFLDNEKRLSYELFKGSPGKLRVKFLPVFSTDGLKNEDWKDLRDRIYTLMYNELAQQKLIDKGLMQPDDHWSPE